MKKERLKKDLELVHRHLTRAEAVMEKISTNLNIPENHEFLERTIYEVEELLKMFEGSKYNNG